MALWKPFQNWQGGEKNTGAPDGPPRTRLAWRLAQLSDRQHEPDQVRLPGDVKCLVDLLQVPIHRVSGEYRTPTPPNVA